MNTPLSRCIEVFAKYAAHLGNGCLAKSRLSSIEGNSLAKDYVRQAARTVLKSLA